ncbi:MAG: hypothetical protein LBM61_07460 [Prevotellaceae bacterium]|nr:hypothetical protein [Prevotellaceae bacterium]
MTKQELTDFFDYLATIPFEINTTVYISKKVFACIEQIGAKIDSNAKNIVKNINDEPHS